MKKFSTLFLFVLLFTATMAQTPEGFKYQAVLRDAMGNVKVSTNVTLAIDLLQGSETGTSVYAETHAVQTNAFGLVNLTIGGVTPPFGTLMFLTCSIVNVPLADFIKEAMPFIVAVILVLFLITYFPWLVTFLPNLIMK